MEFLERVWDSTGMVMGGLLRGFERGVTSVFGSSNARQVRRLQSDVAAINELEPKLQQMTDEELRDQTRLFRERLADGATLDDLLVEAFAVCREAGRRWLGMRHYDTQMIGGMVLHSGAIAEMVTGEGKTLVATLPAYLNALEGKGVHVVTVNDYLARRDMEWMAPLYLGLGLTVGAIQSDMPVDERQHAYACDITYGTNNEFGFDYLRDNMRPAARGDELFPKSMQQSQGPLNFAIIDEVDNILIDEARTPLIISGVANENPRRYAEADRIARELQRNEHFEVSEKDHSVTLTDSGVRQAERLAGVETFYSAGNMEWPHLIDNALKAHYLYHRDVNYVVKEGRVVIVDEFTGRLMEGRQWSDGLHQAVEAKEGVKIKEETQTLATITLQNFFKLYKKICGMTGTAMTEANEFWKIYQLDVIAIPTNRSMKRLEFADKIFCTEDEKYKAIADEIEKLIKWDVIYLKKGDPVFGTILKEDAADHVVIQPQMSNNKQTIQRSDIASIQHRGRPVLVGTVSIEKSERLSNMLDRRGIKHQVLNAKHHQREAEIVAQAGRIGAVTIATNMAGRGTDIILGGNPETMAWAVLQDKYPTRLEVPKEEWDQLVREIDQREQMKPEGEKVRQLGGLHVIGTERHEARRIDLQLRGRCGRQGDPGSSQFYLSLQDDLMRIFAGPWVEKILKSLGLPEGEPIESRMVTRRIEAAQKKVEERNFEIRKNLLEYDEVMDEQRKRVYRFRQSILDNGDCRQLIMDMVQDQIQQHVDTFLARDYGTASFAAWAGSKMSTTFEPKLFRGLDIDAAGRLAAEEADRMVETQIFDAVEENLPHDEDSSEWNWEALARQANSTWGLNLTDRELKKVGREGVAELLLERARDALHKIDLSEGAELLDDAYGLRCLVGWVLHKFQLNIPLDAVRGKDPAAVVDLIRQGAEQVYQQRELDYPVLVGLTRFSQRTNSGEVRLDREGASRWIAGRFETPVDHEALLSMSHAEVRDLLARSSRQHMAQAAPIYQQIESRVDELFRDARPDETVGIAAAQDGALASLQEWMRSTLDLEIPEIELRRLEREQLRQRLRLAAEERFRPEMRRMERSVTLHLVDSAWKEHLLAMDHLRDAIRLVSYAQVDPKVEYKREGMRLFEQMWKSLGQQISDLVFRIEALDEGFVRSTWVETRAVHEAAPQVYQTAAAQGGSTTRTAAASKPSGGGAGTATAEPEDEAAAQAETVRNREMRVGRNDPCPCGSGKKYKSCCLRRHE
ncbi:MAG: SEC-C metal-binding domain-containing protein [Pirellulales bacterium]